ncbi:MAG: DNA-protecting protein DprA [Bacteroidales bacterium]|nr:DNA-protecting protein DprA [Bacteroidales bacterium]
MTGLTYSIALSLVRGMHPSVAEELLNRIGSEKDFFTLPESELCRITGRKLQIFSDDYRKQILLTAEEEERFCISNRIRCLYHTDADYPQRLLQCEDAPLMLFGLGTMNLNARHVVSIVGTRNATTYGVNFINRLIEDLAAKLDDVAIVSGLAMGCDIAAHKGAMAQGLPTAGVVAHGLDTLYPADHRRYAADMIRKGGLLLTDYPHGTRPHRGNFLARNRIVAGISDAVIVVESGAPKGGALHTARLAMLYNRDVFALPGRSSDIYSAGCNMLIKNNVAHLIENADDLIAVMNWTTRPTEGTQQQLFTELSPQQQQIMDFLHHNGEAQINNLTAALGIPVGQLMAMLTEMEFNGLLLSLPGARFRPA